MTLTAIIKTAISIKYDLRSTLWKICGTRKTCVGYIQIFLYICFAHFQKVSNYKPSYILEFDYIVKSLKICPIYVNIPDKNLFYSRFMDDKHRDDNIH